MTSAPHVPGFLGRAPVVRPIPAWAHIRRRLDTRTRALGALATIALIAFGVRAIPVLTGAGLYGLHGYDDGVYFAAAMGFTHGLMPYRDFLLVHPPGIVLTLAPFALLGSLVGDANALAVARVAFMLLGAVNAVLVALVAGRYGRSAGLVAGLVYAVWSTASNVERNTDMHGPQSTLLLLTLLVLSRPGRIGPRRAALVGTLIGLLTSIQLWQGATAIVVLWWIVVRGRGRGPDRLWPVAAYGVGAAVAFGLVCLPFLLAAPDAMVHMALVDQIGRPRAATSFFNRLRAVEGFPQLPQLRPELRRLLPPPVVLGAALAALALVVLTAWRRVWTRPWAAMAFVQVLIVLVTPSFFNDYPSFAAPAATLVIGTGLVATAQAAVKHGLPPADAVAPIVVILLCAGFVSVARVEGTRLPLVELEQDVASARCVTTDSPVLLALTSSLHRSVDHGCPLVVDPTGYELGNRRLRSAAYQAAMIDWYTSGDAALFVRLKTDGLTDASQAAIKARLPIERSRGPVTVRLASP